MRYDVIVVGFRLNASLKPAQALQLVLGLDADTSKELTRRFPSSVLTGVSLSRAERVSQELTDAGAKVEVRESRLSLASEGPAAASRPAPHKEPQEEASGNYEIGEILAPFGKSGASVPAPVAPAATSVTKRASRAELDAALRDSFRPGQEQPAPQPAAVVSAVKPKPAPAPPPAAAASAVTPKPTQAGPAEDQFELMDNSAFAGMQNFGEGLDGFDQAEAPKLQVDEVALRSIQRRPDSFDGASLEPPSVGARLGQWLSSVAAVALDWGTALLSLLVVAGITLLAVGYALDPENVLAPIGIDTLSAGAKKLFGELLGK